MKVLVLGASGYLGSYVYSKLQQIDYEVYGTSYRSLRESLYKIDVNDKNQAKKIIDIKPDIVIWSLMSQDDEKKLTECGLSYILKMLPQSTKFIYMSSDSVFSSGRGDYKEDDPTQYLSEDNPLYLYANAKVDAEKKVKEHKNHIIVRTGPIYGKDVNGNWDNRVSFLYENLRNMKRIMRAINLYKTFIHIDDLSNALIEMIKLDYVGIIHVGPLEKESYYSFNKKIAKELDLDDSLIDEDYLTKDEANSRGIPLDTSLNTLKSRKILSTSFRHVGSKYFNSGGISNE